MTIMETLKNKVAAVFAANGAIASAVARSMAHKNAEVYLSGRNFEAVKALEADINAHGGKAHAFQVDATLETDIDSFIGHIMGEKGRLDVVFNGIGLRAEELRYGTPSIQLPFEKFMEALKVHLGSQFLTSRVAAKHMMQAGTQGTIITLSASLSRIKAPFMAGITAACSGIEGLTRSLASEFGRAGIRVICLNSTALAETRTIKETNRLNAKTLGISEEVFAEQLQHSYLLGKSPSPADIGQFAAFLATDTGTLLNSHVVDVDFGVYNVI